MATRFVSISILDIWGLCRDLDFLADRPADIAREVLARLAASSLRGGAAFFGLAAQPLDHGENRITMAPRFVRCVASLLG